MDQTKDKPGLASRIGRPLLAATLAAGAAASMPAAADVFLKLEGIAGESTDNKHKGEIEVLSYTQSFSNPGTFSAGELDHKGKVSCGMVTILKFVDKSSPALILHVTMGRHVKQGVITFRTTGEKGIEYYKVTMTDVIITGLTQANHTSDPRIMENVALLAERFVFEYTPVDPKTGAIGTKTVFGWDCAANKKF